MLSQKLQDDLMSAYHKVYEEKTGHAAGDSDMEKQASQLASDVRYKAKGKVPQGATEEEKRKIFLQILGASPAPNVVKAMAKEKLMGEKKKKTVKEDKYDNRYSDNTGEESKKKKKALEKKRGMKLDKHPQFTREGSSYGITKGDGKPKGAMAAFGKKEKDKKKTMKEEQKAPRMQKGAMAYDGPNKERSEAADRVLAKTKAKRKKMKEDVEQIDELNLDTYSQYVTRARKDKNKDRTKGIERARRRKHDTISDLVGKEEEKRKKKMKEEYVGEAKMKSKPKNPKDMSKGVGQAAPVDYRTLAQSYAPVGNIFNEKKLDAVGAEDKDIDNDGDHDSTDKYLLKRRKAIGKAIAKKRGRVKEGFSAWRIDLDFNEQVKK